MDRDLETLEKQAYRESYSDGLIDLFVGISVAWIGVAWLWIPRVAGLAGLLPAVLAPTLIPVRKHLIESRAGHVVWSSSRRGWERRQLRALLALGVGALAVAAFVLADDRVEVGEAAAGLPAVLIAAPILLLGVASGLKRPVAYAAILFAAGITTVVAGADPGFDLLAGGLLMTIVGSFLWFRFLRPAPRPDA